MQPSENESSVNDGPPKALTSDYIGIGLLACMLCIGGPLNVLSLLKVFGISVKKATWWSCHSGLSAVSEPRRKDRQRLSLNFHLIIANLLVIWVYVLSEVCWRCTYQWLGGDALCRMVRFIHAFCFYATSNLVSTIALDRLFLAIKVDRPGARAARKNAVRWFANCAWTLAFLCSLPQLYVFRTFEPYPNWQQCVTIWDVARYTAQSKYAPEITLSFTVWMNITRLSPETSQKNLQTDVDRANYYEKFYSGFHLAFVFWFPVLVIFVCYTLIVTRFHNHIVKSRGVTLRNAEHGSNSNLASVSTTPMRSPQPTRRFSKQGYQQTSFRALEESTCANDETKLMKDSPRHPISDKPTLKSWCCIPYSNNGNQSHFPRSHRNSSRRPSDQTTVNIPASANLLNAGLNIGASQPLLPKNFAANTLMRAKRRTVKKSVWILTVYFLCWSPYNVLSLWRYIHPGFDYSFLEILNDLIVLNAVVNPLIYGI